MSTAFPKNSDYRYEHFTRDLMREDSRFAGGPLPGDRMSDFNVATSNGGRVRLDDFQGRKPFLLTLGSFT